MAADPLYWGTILACNFDGTNGQTTFTDEGPKYKQKTLTGFGGVALTTTGSRFGTACLNLTGATQRIDLADHVDFTLANNDFTIEAWIYISGNSALDGGSSRRAYIVGTNGNQLTTTYWLLAIAGNSTTTGTGIEFQSYVSNNNYSRSIPYTITQGTWHHIAISRNANGVYFGIDGVIVTTQPITQSISRGPFPNIGGINNAGAWPWYFVGKIDALRIIKDAALYTSDYSMPPITGGQYSSANSLLLHFDGTNGQTTFTDSSTTPKTLTGYGTAQLSTTAVQYGTTSLYLNGSSYIDLPMSSDFDFGSGDFTIDFWLYYTGSTTGIYTFLTPASDTYGTPWVIDIENGYVRAYFSTTGMNWAPILTDSTQITLSTWTHVAVARKGNIFSLVVNGRMTNATAAITLYSTPAAKLNIGKWANGDTRYPTCYIDELRIVKGIGYFSNSTYTVPTSAPDFSGTPEASYSPQSNGYLSGSIPTYSMGNCGLISHTNTGHPLSSGSGYLSGTIKFRYPPDLPVKKKVGLMCETTGAFIQYTWSDPVTGAYRFDGVNPELKYSVIAYDDTGTYGASVASGLVPTGY